MGRRHGRITKEDVLEAGFRRWDGRQRVTTDWVNVFNEPELQWPNGDILVYLREPGQSSRGPAFRVHSSRIRSKGFGHIIEHCTPRRRSIHESQCIIRDCAGCAVHSSVQELYVPAPIQSGLDATFDHHVTTRNFFAWIYNIPLVGRALGKSLKAVRDRIDKYRPGTKEQNKAEIIAFAESQKYLDFRECVDHALAALYIAEDFGIDDLWVDAFAHCVGLSHRGMRESIEYEHISGRSKLLIKKARLDLDAKLNRVERSVSSFFEDDLSGDFLGLSPNARDHLDRFRSFLHSFYIERHGFWPPNNFDQESVRTRVCNSMYSDFKNLYHHLADTESPDIGKDLATNGGVCTLQNIRAFDARRQYDSLPQALPMLPTTDSVELGVKTKSQRRKSWNPVANRKLEREHRNARRMQALIAASNRDWNLMNSLLVRRYSDFEVESAVDDLEPITLAEGRKVRWIAIYAILQTLISVMEAPKQVRNIEGLSYSLCCRAPELMPWKTPSARASRVDLEQGIQPDLAYSHTNTTMETLGRSASRDALNTLQTTSRERRKTLTTTPSTHIPDHKSSTRTTRSKSLRKLVTMRSATASPEVPKLTTRQSFCEIYVPGYGNGLNEVDIQMTASPVETVSSATFTTATHEASRRNSDYVPKLPGSISVSRESSNASSNSSRSSDSTQSSEEVSTPVDLSLGDLGLKLSTDDIKSELRKGDTISVVTQDIGLGTVHFNTQTWDEMLKV